jgi:hypothetical protein
MILTAHSSVSKRHGWGGRNRALNLDPQAEWLKRSQKIWTYPVIANGKLLRLRSVISDDIKPPENSAFAVPFHEINSLLSAS